MNGLPNPHLFITFDGLDATGKTTLSRLVAERLGAKWIRTPPPELEATRGQVDRTYTPDAHFLFYMAGVIEVSNRVRLLLEAGPVICDRYIWSTLAYHRAMGSIVALQWPEVDFIRPDVAFLISASAETRRNRMLARGKATPGDIRVFGLEQRIHYEFLAFTELVQLDTTHLDVGSATNTAFDAISRACGIRGKDRPSDRKEHQQDPASIHRSKPDEPRMAAAGH